MDSDDDVKIIESDDEEKTVESDGEEKTMEMDDEEITMDWDSEEEKIESYQKEESPPPPPVLSPLLVPVPAELAEEHVMNVLITPTDWIIDLGDIPVPDDPNFLEKKRHGNCFRHFEKLRVLHFFELLSKSIRMAARNKCTKLNVEMQSIRPEDFVSVMKFLKIPENVGFTVSWTEKGKDTPTFEYSADRISTQLGTLFIRCGPEPMEKLLFNGFSWYGFPHILINNGEWITEKHLVILKECISVHILQTAISSEMINKFIRYLINQRDAKIRELIIETGDIDFKEIVKGFRIFPIALKDPYRAREHLIFRKQCCVHNYERVSVGIIEKPSYEEIIHYSPMESVHYQMSKCPRFRQSERAFIKSREKLSSLIVVFPNFQLPPEVLIPKV
uniref:FTH domain-containing protein n=1 Tax=Caenorhabditis tropicalis TaxID=1561998 RepID=A0A1I7TB99_9PELO